MEPAGVLRLAGRAEHPVLANPGGVEFNQWVPGVRGKVWLQPGVRAGVGRVDGERVMVGVRVGAGVEIHRILAGRNVEPSYRPPGGIELDPGRVRRSAHNEVTASGGELASRHVSAAVAGA